MNRDEYLKNAWSPYPPAQQGWMDVATFLKQDGISSTVCGRLSFDGETKWRLESGGAHLEFAFHDAAYWIAPQKLPSEFSREILQPGDLVALELHRTHQTDRQWLATHVLLLAPARVEPPRATNFTVERSRQWAGFLAGVREHFVSRGFIEALTPTLVPSPGTEPFLDPFSTEWFVGSQAKTLFLPTSPEFHLKKMLVRGWTRVFEFKPCFRNGEISEHHQPEFLMLEWYRAYSDLDAIADDVETLLATLAARFGMSDVPSLKRTTMAELFAGAFAGFRLTPKTTREELADLASREGISVSGDDSWDDVFFRLFLEKIESRLGHDGPLLVRGYPPSQAALSRIGPDGFADRFEVYWKGLELANAFHELNDPIENEARFREDARKKAELGKPPVPVDEELVRHLHSGLPPSGGIALGLDRLFMALFGIDSIADARAFPAKM